MKIEFIQKRNEFALHITKYKQQLRKLLFVFAGSLVLMIIIRLFEIHALQVVMPQAKCRLYAPQVNQTSFSVLSWCIDASAPLGWHWHMLTECKAVAKRGAPGSWWGPHVTRRLGLGGPQNFMTPGARIHVNIGIQISKFTWIRAPGYHFHSIYGHPAVKIGTPSNNEILPLLIMSVGVSV